MKHYIVQTDNGEHWYSDAKSPAAAAKEAAEQMGLHDASKIHVRQLYEEEHEFYVRLVTSTQVKPVPKVVIK